MYNVEIRLDKTNVETGNHCSLNLSLFVSHREIHSYINSGRPVIFSGRFVQNKKKQDKQIFISTGSIAKQEEKENMLLDPLFRRMTIFVAFFSIIGVILGVVALGTNYWTITNVGNEGVVMQTTNGTVMMNNWTWIGLFYMFSSMENVPCVTRFVTSTFIICLLGLIFMLVGGIFSIWEMFQTSDRRFLMPFFFFVACVLMTAGLFDYGSMALLNYHSTRLMISSIVFCYVALPIAAFISGRYSAYDRFINNANGQKYVAANTNGN